MDKLSLNQTDIQKWKKNLLLFLGPVLVLYITGVQVVIQQSGFSLQAFVPTSFTAGGIVLYLINATLDYFKKLKNL